MQKKARESVTSKSELSSKSPMKNSAPKSVFSDKRSRRSCKFNYAKDEGTDEELPSPVLPRVSATERPDELDKQKHR